MIQLKESREKLKLANRSAHRLLSLQVWRNWTRRSKAMCFRMRCTNMGTEPLNLQFYVTMSIKILESVSTMNWRMCSRQAISKPSDYRFFYVHHKSKKAPKSKKTHTWGQIFAIFFLSIFCKIEVKFQVIIDSSMCITRVKKLTHALFHIVHIIQS